MKPVIGFCNTKGSFISDTIIYFQKWIWHNAKWSHVYFSYDDHLIFESTFPLVKLSVCEKYKKRMNEFKEYSVDVPIGLWIKAVREFMREYDESPYSFMSLFGFIWVFVIRKLFNREVRNPFKSGTVCSELGYRFVLYLRDRKIIKLNVLISANQDADSVSPMDLESLIKDNPKIFIEIKK